MRPPAYVLWAVLACISYSLVAPLVRVATAQVPSNVAAFLSNGVLLVVIIGVVAVSSESIGPYVMTRGAGFLYLAGLFLGIGILAYYRALELGPVSIVVPIFAMFIVGGSVIGFALLDETITIRRVGGILLAILAVYLIST